jgi:hypothetical protein
MNLVHCPNCDFITTEVEIPELSLNNLYFDYRTATYNQDRSKYEPGYLDISSKIGDAEEINYRVQSLNRYLDQFEDTVFDPTRVKVSFCPDLALKRRSTCWKFPMPSRCST